MLPEELLQQVERPARYIGGEWNQIVKPDADVRIALCYPDLYDIGMSHLGLRILYEGVNQRPDAAAERVFLPWTDAIALMREHGIVLTGLESDTPLDEFDLVGITLQHELTYTNILALLELGRIPVLSADRRGHHPLVIAGGPCAFNPEPIADFIDLFVIGDGEEALDELLDRFLALPEHLKDRPERSDEMRREALARLAETPGVYMPANYRLEQADTGQMVPVPAAEDVPAQVTRRLSLDLDSLPYPVKPIVPFCETVHDRAEVEIARGCSRGCRFCQAGMVYRPVRERDESLLVDQIEQIARNTGHDSVSLLSLNCPDYSEIEALLSDLNERLRERRISIGLPSLRVDTFSVALAQSVQTVRKSGLTLAPEAGSQRMRDIINKCVTEEDLLATVGTAFDLGWTRLKLYFMIGLPMETDDDVRAIPDMVNAVLHMARGQLNRSQFGRLKIGVSVNSFVPKPHTPFQWLGHADEETLAARRTIVARGLRDRRINVSFNNAHQSVLEAALARGDRRVGPAVLAAYRAGAIYDAWTEHFNLGLWSEAFDEVGLDMTAEATREIPVDAHLPWDVIDSGVRKSYFADELERAASAALTPDCRLAGCHGCGINALAGSCPLVQDSAGDVREAPAT